MFCKFNLLPNVILLDCFKLIIFIFSDCALKFNYNREKQMIENTIIRITGIKRVRVYVFIYLLFSNIVLIPFLILIIIFSVKYFLLFSNFLSLFKTILVRINKG